MTLIGRDGTNKASFTLAEPITLSSNISTTITLSFSLNRVKGDINTYLTSLRIQEEEQDVTTASYTINYKDGESIVKTVSSKGVVDQVITAEVAIDGTETGYEGNHYLITAAEAPSMTLVAEDASNVLNVPVRAPYTATLKVTTTVGTNDPVLVETPLVETDAKVHTWSYAYPMYKSDGGKYYKADNTTTFGEGGEFTDGQVIEKSVTYSTVDEDVVFFQEAEAAAGTNYLYSNGGSGYVAAQNKRDRGISLGTLPAGMYQFIVNITAANKRSLGIRQSTNDHIASVGTSNEDMNTGLKSTDFELNAETSNLWINGANSGTDKTNQSEDFDYVLIKKVQATVSISDAGWATLYTPYALNFEGTGLTAYTATCDGSTVTLTGVENVPANTGVVLKGDANTYSIPAIASSSTAQGSLEGNATEATAFDKFAGKTLYVLAQNGNKVQFQPVTSGEIAAGKAYLPLASGNVKALSVAFGTATGINAVESARQDGMMFNLAGQRVSMPARGLYIKNGKKVVVK